MAHHQLSYKFGKETVMTAAGMKHEKAMSEIRQRIEHLTEERKRLLTFIENQERMLVGKRQVVEDMALDILSLRTSLDKLADA